jgi:hypothetical protein
MKPALIEPDYFQESHSIDQVLQSQSALHIAGLGLVGLWEHLHKDSYKETRGGRTC